MKNLLMQRLPRVVTMLLAGMLTLTALAPLASAGRTAENYDGRDLVRGLLLGSGDVAQQLPEVFGELPKMPEETMKAEELLLDKLEGENPEFLAMFAKVIAAGDHVMVMEALNEGAEILNKTVADGQIFADFGYRLPYHWTWLPYRWHFRFQPFLWNQYRWNYNYNYNYGFDYDGTLGYRYFTPWNPVLVNEFERFELDAESQLANERFVDLVVDRLGH